MNKISSSPTPRQQRYLARLAAAKDRLLRSIAGLDEQALTSDFVVDGWTIKDMLGHIVSWDDEFRREIQVILQGGHPGYELVINGDDDFAAWNQHWIEQKRDWPWERVMADVERDFREVAQLILGLSPQDYRQRAVTPWKKAAITRSAALTRADTDSVDTLVTFHWRHTNQHVGLIEKWRKKG